jgi:hypothetical protein
MRNERREAHGKLTAPDGQLADGERAVQSAGLPRYQHDHHVKRRREAYAGLARHLLTIEYDWDDWAFRFLSDMATPQRWLTERQTSKISGWRRCRCMTPCRSFIS